MKTLKKIIIGFIALLVVIVIYITIAGNKKYNAPFPDIVASTDPDVIARGEYLVYGFAHCATCHMPADKVMEVEKGVKHPLTGGWEFDIPPMTIRAPNLTPDVETGIGSRTDGELARTLRYGVAHDGKYVAPVMPYNQMSDADLQAVISFLRSQPAVHNKVEPTKIKFLGKALLAFGVLKPVPVDQQPPKTVPMHDQLALGEYLTNNVANCTGCHTEMNLVTGQFIGSPLAGGMHFEPDEFSQGYGFITPNLTPDAETGIMAGWTEDYFVTRFKAGRIHQGSHMPWGAFTQTDTSDLKAIYAYLKSLEPVHNRIEKIVFLPGESMK